MSAFRMIGRVGRRAIVAMAALATLVGASAPLPLAAQHPATSAQVPGEPGAPVEKKLGPADIIMPHITDSKTIEYPCFRGVGEWACEYTFAVHNVTVAGHTFDLGLTKHIFFMMLSAVLVCLLLLFTARAHVRSTHAVGRPKGFAAGLEAVILYLRNEIYIPVLGGHGGAGYVPFCLTLFFFIVFCNLFGLIPYGSTPTGNIAVTATLAAVTFVVVEVAGMRTLGKGYIGTIIYWPHDMPFLMKAGLTIVMTPVEIVGKFTKPFALTIRLFANMIAGHVIILALIGMIFLFGWVISPLPVLMAIGIMVLEILVAFIQAFIFSLLAAVFIGQIRMAHH
jgi:F-type H+-transporting ATPase subunit a